MVVTEVSEVMAWVDGEVTAVTEAMEDMELAVLEDMVVMAKATRSVRLNIHLHT